MPVRPVSSKKGAAQGKSLSNLFDNPEMNESQDHNLLGTAVIDAHDVITVEDATQTQQKEVYELESSEAEMQFESSACFKTLVIEASKNYKSDEIDLVTTNTAMNS